MKKIFVGIFLFATTILSAADAPKVEWGVESVEKTWPDAVLFCNDNGQRLPTKDEVSTLGDKQNLIWNNESNLFENFSTSVKCVIDADKQKLASLQLKNMKDIKTVCDSKRGTETSKKEKDNGIFSEKLVGFFSKTAENIGKVADSASGLLVSPRTFSDRVAYHSGVFDESTAALNNEKCEQIDKFYEKLSIATK